MKVENMEIAEPIDAPPAEAPPLPQPMAPSRWKKVLRTLGGLAVWTAAGLLLWLCYFPVACGWFGWIALVPLLFLVRSTARLRSVYFQSWIVGSAFFWTALSWMRVADDRMYATWAMLAFYCSLYFPLAIGMLRFLDRRARLPLVLTVPVVWTALEFLRAHLMTGFAWYFLAHTQHDFLLAIQISDLGGAYAVTFVVAAFNAMVFECLYRIGRLRRWFSQQEPAMPLGRWKWALQTVAVVALVLGSLFYGMWQLGQDQFVSVNDSLEWPRIALIQSNLDQRLRNTAAPGNNAAARMVIHNRQLMDWAVHLDYSPLLIAWPETSYPEDWVEISPEVPADQIPLEWRHRRQESEELAKLAAGRWKTNILLGMNAEQLEANGKRSRYNSAVLIQKDGTSGGRYNKMHRVPFGEFVPLRDWLPWMNKLAPYDFDYSIRPGEEFTRFSLNNHRFGVIICYEDTDPDLARQYVRPGEPPVDFLVNISNDGWFNGSAEHEEHLAICRFRAVECRRPIARAVNMGISVVIDSNGRVIWPYWHYRRWPDGRVEQDDPPQDGSEFYQRRDADNAFPFRQFLTNYFPFLGRIIRDGDLHYPMVPVREWSDFKQVAGVFAYRIPLDTRSSLYARYGDWLPWSCWAILAMGLVWGMVRNKEPRP